MTGGATTLYSFWYVWTNDHGPSDPPQPTHSREAIKKSFEKSNVTSANLKSIGLVSGKNQRDNFQLHRRDILYILYVHKISMYIYLVQRKPNFLQDI